MAKSSAFPADVADECSVCYEYFHHPKVLPCRHLLCRNCLVAWLKSDEEAGCPLCRRQILDPSQDTDKSVEQIVDAFPTARSRGWDSRRDQDRGQRHVCRTCPYRDDVRTCLYCGGDLCEKCVDLHFRFPAVRRRECEDGSYHGSEDPAHCGQVFCAGHADRLADVFCCSHLQAVCRACADAVHGSCSGKKTLERKTMEEDDLLLLSLLEKQRAAATTLQDLLRELRHLRRLGVENSLLHDFARRSDEEWTRLEASLQACRQRMSVTLAEVTGQAPASQCRGLMTHSSKALPHDIKTEGSEKPLSEPMGYMVHGLGQPDPSGFLSPTDGVVTMPAINIDDILEHLEQSVTARHVQETFQLHTTRNGVGIQLSDNDTTATKICPDVNGDEIVVSRQAMLVGSLYEVQIQTTTDRFTWLYTGVLCIHPDTLSLLTTAQCLDYAIVIYHNSVMAFGETTSNTCGRLLKNPPQGRRVGVLLDFDDCLHLYVDGRDQGVAARDLQQPCHALFDLRHGVEKEKRFQPQAVRASCDLISKLKPRADGADLELLNRQD